MSLPDSRNTTYTPSAAPAVASADLNALQDYLVDVWQASRGHDCLISDDFLGGTLDSAKWIASSGGGFTAPTLPTPDTLAAGGYGVLQLSATFSAGTVQSQIQTANAFVGSRDYRMVALVRVSAMGGTGSQFAINPLGVENGSNVGFSVKNGSSHWFAYDDFAVPGVRADTDLGVVAASTAGYDLIEIRRTSGVYEWWVNGAKLRTQTPSPVSASVGAPLTIVAGASTSGTTTARIDKLAMWARR